MKATKVEVTEIKDLAKSLTVKVGAIGSAVMATMIAVPDQAQELMIGLGGMTEQAATLWYKLVGFISGILTLMGIGYGRKRADEKPKLTDRA